ncbi:MAG TPA: aldehyde dehydrogenase family protein, partial [Pseudonocardia sp.]
MTSSSGLLFWDRHRSTLAAAAAASRSRYAWSAYQGAVCPEPHGAAERAFLAHLGGAFDLGQPGRLLPREDEVSPYTGQPLRVRYPVAEVEELTVAATVAWPRWRLADPRQRLGVCLEIADRLFRRNGELGLAAMHTTGQSAAMSRSGSGTNALDRGLEALVKVHELTERIPTTGIWSRHFGRSTVTLEKRYRTVPVGLSTVVACASFPAWNVYPALLANLASGNPVIVKPHPTSVLQMALAVSVCREVLREA